jgi:MHS family proline/betaine transporter-like MFS transporter
MKRAVALTEPKASPTVPQLAKTDIRKRQVAVGIGNFMEWFDFAIYGYFVAVIGAQFFPAGDPATEVLSSLAVFAVGFIARPLGAVVLGPIGDRHGRKLVLVITVLGMGLTTALIGVIPSYASIGVAAPILVVILRCIQGMMSAVNGRPPLRTWARAPRQTGGGSTPAWSPQPPVWHSLLEQSWLQPSMAS